jgi:hydroxymethylbilane synthase
MDEGRLLKSVPVPFNRDRVLDTQWIWLAKGTAWPEDIEPRSDQKFWVAGTETWKAMAQKGHWVCGSCEGLGESLLGDLSSLVSGDQKWLKLTHVGAIDFGPYSAIGTYALVTDQKVDPNIKDVSHFYWSSYSNFEEALLRWPDIRYAQHACGPGQSAELIRAALGADAYKLQVFISFDEWRARLPRKNVKG